MPVHLNVKKRKFLKAIFITGKIGTKWIRIWTKESTGLMQKERTGTKIHGTAGKSLATVNKQV